MINFFNFSLLKITFWAFLLGSGLKFNFHWKAQSLVSHKSLWRSVVVAVMFWILEQRKSCRLLNFSSQLINPLELFEWTLSWNDQIYGSTDRILDKFRWNFLKIVILLFITLPTINEGVKTDRFPNATKLSNIVPVHYYSCYQMFLRK